MKNLIFYICNSFYKDSLLVNLEFLKKYNNIDTCCIAARDLVFDEKELKPTHVLYVDDFDFKYTAKYIINSWKFINNEYENFLYVDVDAIPFKNLAGVFDIIENNKEILHGVKEFDNFNTGTSYHRFRQELQHPAEQCGFNAGTFGFNKNFIKYFDDFLNFIEENKFNVICDQPLYNEFFIENQIIQPTLTPFVFLNTESAYYSKIDANGTLFNESSIVHFLGGAFKGKCARTMRDYINNNL